tara:strand:+ start:3960 stop:4913 length:954 start_codon:yes stop_codon:yes gene_type:complete
MTNLLVFPGQGSQFIGMGKSFAENFRVSKEIFEEINETLSLNLTKIMWDGDIETLTMTENAQPAIMAVSIATLAAIDHEIGIDYDKVGFLAGHSLGEYSALVASNILDYNSVATLLRLRGGAMQDAVPSGKGAMAAIIGCLIQEVESLVEEVNSIYPDKVCDIANDNSQGQVVISGNKESIEKAIELAVNYGSKKAILLPVSAPFHCRLMIPAAEVMDNALAKYNFKNPRVPIISNITANAEKSEDIIKELLVKQVTGRVRWAETINFASCNGVKRIYEIGAGKILTGLSKRIDRNLEAINIDEPNQIDKFKLDFEY